MPLNPELLIIVHRRLRSHPQPSAHFNHKCMCACPRSRSRFSGNGTESAGLRLSECRAARSGDRCAPRRSSRRRTPERWWHSRAFSVCGGRAPASDSTKPTSRARHKTDALRFKHVSCFKRRMRKLLGHIPQRRTIRVFKARAGADRLSRRVRFVRARRAPHYK